MTPVPALHPRIAVNTMCLAGTRLDDDCDWARSIGASMISITPQKLDAMGWEAGVDAVRRSGLGVATVVSSMQFQLDDPSSWPAIRAKGCRVVDAAAAMVAR